MAEPKLFDYNTSFGILRTNPKLTGNVRVTLDSTGNVWLNSMNANPTLSLSKFKKYSVSGENSYSKDLYNFFSEGSVSNDIIFDVGKFTDGENKSVENFVEQYDFFYGSGASTLIDRNYTENFTYFQPLWLRDELPEFFVIFKIPEPLSYPYSTNQTSISAGVQYKIVQDPDVNDIFTITYGLDNAGIPVEYIAGEFITGDSLYPGYTIVSGSGKVVEMDELKYQSQVDDVQSFFNSKILPYATTVATFDLRSETQIGKYIRGIVNDPLYREYPIDFSFQNDTYSYYNGASIKDGVLTQRGELLNSYLNSNQSTVQSDFEDYVTSGFERNGVICANILNLEFLFNDPDADLYSINRYFGCYVSKNDLGEIYSNGDFFYKFRNLEGNNNLPRPVRNNVGYYYNNVNNLQSSETGVRFFYEGASGWIPGSYDVNVNDPQKLYYLTDKYDNFYNIKRYENYDSSTNSWLNNTPDDYQFGPYSSSGFGVTGDVTKKTGSLVLGSTSLNLSDFTGSGDMIGSFTGSLPNTNGKAMIDIQFLQNVGLTGGVVFKIFWPNGSQIEEAGRYDLIKSGEFGGSVLGWTEGSCYNVGSEHYFNGIQGDTSDVARSFSDCVSNISETYWDSAPSTSYSIIRSKSAGSSLNSLISVSVFDDYANFESKYNGVWNNSLAYSIGDVVYYFGKYYEALQNVAAPVSGSFNDSPVDDVLSWEVHYTYSRSGDIEIAGIDVSDISGNVYFDGGTDYPLCRVAFNIQEIDKVVPGAWIQVENGRGVTGGMSRIKSVTRYVDSPVYDSTVGKTYGTVTSFRGFGELLVANLEDPRARINLGSDSKFNLFEMSKLYTGVFSFFDLKDFDFDFWSSSYGITPTEEYHRYFELISGQSGQLVAGQKYLVRQGSVRVDIGLGTERTLQQNDAFIATSVSYFNDIGSSTTGVKAIVVPAAFTQIGWVTEGTTYNSQAIQAEQNLNGFNGFYGIQSIIDNTVTNPNDKGQLFQAGKLGTEYEYLQENYTKSRANRSRIVPYINKWGYYGGTDARGNHYRLNVSPAFSPTNFSPSFERETPDTKYLTHEWLLLEGIPREYPIQGITSQRSYLPHKVDLSKIKSGNPADYLYFSSFFTVDPNDYPSPYNIPANPVKELFTPFNFDLPNGFYQTLFRGVKINLKRRSTVPNPQSDLEKYVPNYRGFEDYKFAAILRVVPEDDSIIQPPVSYEFIENMEQKSILFVCSVVIKDYRALPLDYSGATGGTPYLDYLLMYSLSDKKRKTDVGATGSAGPTGSPLYEIDDIKLSSALDLSIVSGSSVTTTTNPGFIYTIPNPDFDTDLREEIHVYYPVGATASVGITGSGSFSVPAISSTYPWPIGRSGNLVTFGPIGNNYEFDIPFAFSSPVTIPVGPRSSYSGNPVFQIDGGNNYFDFILKRISLSGISDRVNDNSPYIKYTTYYWDPVSLTTKSINNYFEVSMPQPTALFKPSGVYPAQDFSGPQTLGQNNPTGYEILLGGKNYQSDILRYRGGYEPLFKKTLYFKDDKDDTINGYTSVDLSYRNCTFAPEKTGFGTIENLSYSKVSLNNILQASANLPSGPVYPLVGQSPIAIKNQSIFLSSWDPGYYNLYSTSVAQTPVAGTRSMAERKSFFGSKMMQTPYTITTYTFITLEISRTTGSTNVQAINDSAALAVNQIQSINTDTSNTGIGQLGTVYSAVDLPVFDEGIYPNVEVFWQKDTRTNTLKGSIRLDRILRRYLLNSGIEKVFVDNMISEYGVGDPNSIMDDVKAYIDQNIVPIYEGINLSLFVKKTGKILSPTQLLVRGDLISPDRIKYSYYPQPNYTLTQRNALSYYFELPLDSSQNYSTTFSFQIQKI